jgi:ParB-like chromosome segregation protein Spo0J
MVKNISDLQAYSRNSRTHSAGQIEKLAASLREFGMAGAVVIRGDTIAKGHGTTAAAQLLYSRGELLYAAPGRLAGGTPYPSGTVPVIDATGWTDEQFRAFVIADNQLALDAGWDIDVLREEVADLHGEEYDLTLLGFDDAFLNDLLGGDEDDIALPEPARARPVTVLGDMWRFADQRMLCGEVDNPLAIGLLVSGDLSGLKCFTVEHDPARIDAAVRHWQEQTGRVALNEVTGDAFGGEE